MLPISAECEQSKFVLILIRQKTMYMSVTTILYLIIYHLYSYEAKNLCKKVKYVKSGSL